MILELQRDERLALPQGGRFSIELAVDESAANGATAEATCFGITVSGEMIHETPIFPRGFGSADGAVEYAGYEPRRKVETQSFVIVPARASSDTAALYFAVSLKPLGLLADVQAVGCRVAQIERSRVVSWLAEFEFNPQDHCAAVLVLRVVRSGDGWFIERLDAPATILNLEQLPKIIQEYWTAGATD